MKIAFLAIASPDLRSVAMVQPESLPFDRAIKEFKDAVQAGGHPDLTPERNVLLLVDLTGVRKSHKFRVETIPAAQPVEPISEPDSTEPLAPVPDPEPPVEDPTEPVLPPKGKPGKGKTD